MFNDEAFYVLVLICLTIFTGLAIVLQGVDND